MTQMTKTEEKALYFVAALTDAYRDEEDRELEAFSKLELTDDATEDITAMLVAMSVVVKKLTDYDGDLIDFTHMLNKLAVQYIMEGRGDAEM
jgi:TolB-like protein